MENKLNTRAIEDYARVYSGKVLSQFFSKNDKIDGNQILNFSSVKQVNLFILKSLFEQWQRDAGKLRSPFFNFEHEQVVEALKTFMNVLSRHILVSRQHFEPLVYKAVVDTLTLTLSPLTYFTKEIEYYADPLVTTNKLKDLNKYIHINKVLIQAVIKEMDSMRMNEAFAGEVVRLFYNAHHDNKYRITEWYEVMDMFSNIAPVEASELIEENNPVRRPVLKPSEEPHHFRKQPETIPVVKNTPAPKPEPAPLPESMSETEIVMNEFFPSDPPVEKVVEKPTPAQDQEIRLEVRQDMPVATANVTLLDTAAEPAKPVIKSVIIDEDDEVKGNSDKILNDRFVKEQAPTLNDKLKQNPTPTILDKHQNSKIESIRSAIPLNQKFMLINELFDGDNVAWSLALQELENADSVGSAINLIKNKYARQFNWDMNNDKVQSLMALVERKFS